MASVFETLNNINVNGHTEVKESGGTKLTYLSWVWAWAEVKKRYENAKYEIVMNDGLPYVYDENTGYMVFTRVTIDDVTHEMWLPVMDSNNRAMKSSEYELTFKSGKKITIQPATMFDINKTIMRCLVKNLAMFGLGLYIYAGEDLPEVEVEQKTAAEIAKTETERKAKINEVLDMISAKGIDVEVVKDLYKVEDLRDLDVKKCNNILKHEKEIIDLSEKKKAEEKK